MGCCRNLQHGMDEHPRCPILFLHHRYSPLHSSARTVSLQLMLQLAAAIFLAVVFGSALYVDTHPSSGDTCCDVGGALCDEISVLEPGGGIV